MEQIAKTKQLVINLAENHPVFDLEEKNRTHRVQEIIDQYYGNEQNSEVDLAELNARVAILSTKIEMLEEVLQAVKEIKAALVKSTSVTSQPLVEQIKPSLARDHKPSATTTENAEKEKTVKFDVDAFFDLG